MLVAAVAEEPAEPVQRVDLAASDWLAAAVQAQAYDMGLSDFGRVVANTQRLVLAEKTMPFVGRQRVAKAAVARGVFAVRYCLGELGDTFQATLAVGWSARVHLKQNWHFGAQKAPEVEELSVPNNKSLGWPHRPHSTEAVVMGCIEREVGRDTVAMSSAVAFAVKNREQTAVVGR